MLEKSRMLLSIVAALAMTTSPSAAQEAGESKTEQAREQGAQTPYQERVTQLDGVKVTARKREESFLEVPVISNIITQETLDRTKTDNLFTIGNMVPALRLGDTVGAVGTQVSLRGIGTSTINSTMDQSVSLVVDGLPFSQGIAYSTGLFDVGFVEVLKGPQALFFGKNNTAGVIALRSNDPGKERELQIRTGYEYEAEEKLVDVVLSGPVSDSLKLRLAARHSDQNGFFRNQAEGIPELGGRTPEYKNYAPTKETIVRGTALFDSHESFMARLKLNYSKYEMDGGSSPLQTVHCPEGTGGVPPSNIPFIDGDDCKVDRNIHLSWFNLDAYPGGLPNEGVQFQERELFFGTLELDTYLSDDITFSSVTGYFDNEHLSMHQATSTRTTNAGASITPLENRQFSQEFRLTSDYFDRPVNFMLGAFYLKGKQMTGTDFRANTLLGLPPILQHNAFHIDIESMSIFGQVIWDISDRLELAGGARWTDEKREQQQFNFNPAQGPVGSVARPDPSISSSNVSPEVTLTYKPTGNFTAFASYKTGFKSGSFNTITYAPPTTRNSFDDEEVRGGEVGIKARSADGSLVISLAPYYYKYRDLQVGANEISDLGEGNYLIVLRTLNAASATTTGVDIDLSYESATIDGLSLNTAVNYNRGRYDSFPNGPCGNGQTIGMGCDQIFDPATGRYRAQDMSGRRLVRAPEWSGYFGVNRSIPLQRGLSMNFGAGASYTAKYATNLTDLPGFEQDDYIKFDANWSISGANDRWQFALIGHNLTNELTRGWCSNSNNQNGGVLGGQISGAVTGGPAGQDEAACFIERGRQAWARFSWRF